MIKSNKIRQQFSTALTFFSRILNATFVFQTLVGLIIPLFQNKQYLNLASHATRDSVFCKG